MVDDIFAIITEDTTATNPVIIESYRGFSPLLLPNKHTRIRDVKEKPPCLIIKKTISE